MTKQKFSKEELEEKFNLFLSRIDDDLDEFIEKLNSQGYILDYSIKSLDMIEKYLLDKKVTVNDNDYNDSAAYLGEVIIKSYGGQWKCSLNEKENTIYYGYPVIYGHNSYGVEFSPFHSVNIFLIRPRENHFMRAINSQINPQKPNLNHLRED